MAKDIVASLLKLKREIEEARIDRAKLEGALKQNMERLQKEFGVRDLEMAKKKLETLKRSKESLETSLNESVSTLEVLYAKYTE